MAAKETDFRKERFTAEPDDFQVVGPYMWNGKPVTREEQQRLIKEAERKAKKNKK